MQEDTDKLKDEPSTTEIKTTRTSTKSSVKSTDDLVQSSSRVSDLHETNKNISHSLKSLLAMASFLYLSEMAYSGVMIVFVIDFLGVKQNYASMLIMTYKVLSSNLIIVIAFLADNFFGKFPTMISACFFYAISLVCLASLSHPLMEPYRFMIYACLVMRGLGEAGLSACLIPFAIDQFPKDIPPRSVELFYFYCIWIVSFLELSSIVIVTFLKDKLQCFGCKHCYPASFTYCLVTFFIGVLIFAINVHKYSRKKPVRPVCIKAPIIIGYAIWNRCRKGTRNESHWLNYAKDRYDSANVEDVKCVIRVFLFQMFLFWTMLHQRSVMWTVQATRVTRQIGNIHVTAEQVQALYPGFLLLLCPSYFFLCHHYLTKKIKGPLMRMSLASFILTSAFACSAMLSFYIEHDEASDIRKHDVRATFINASNCTLNINNNNNNKNLKSEVEPYSHHSFIVARDIYDGTTFSFDSCQKTWNSTTSYAKIHTKDNYFIVTSGDTKELPDFKVVKDTLYDGTFLYIVCDDYAGRKEVTVTVREETQSKVVRKCDGNMGSYIKATPGHISSLTVDGNSKEVEMNYGDVAVVLIIANENSPMIKILKVLNSRGTSVLWMIPQYLLISLSSVIFMIALFMFQYKETPPSCYSLVWSLKHFNSGLEYAAIATSNLIIRQALVLALWTVGSLLNFLIFWICAKNFNYRTKEPPCSCNRASR